MAQGVERISSQELSARMNVTASQIRQDLNNFGGFGQQGYGYNVAYLYQEIAKILGLDRENSMIIIGCGNFGRALAKYKNFANRGFVTLAMFDVNPEKVGKQESDIPVHHIDELAAFLQNHDVKIAVLTIPREEAVKVAEVLVANGIKAIWNFAHVDLDVPADVVVENVHLSESLMQLSYRIADAAKCRK
jgi:redox-sensing transcriptional repressor